MGHRRRVPERSRSYSRLYCIFRTGGRAVSSRTLLLLLPVCFIAQHSSFPALYPAIGTCHCFGCSWSSIPRYSSIADPQIPLMSHRLSACTNPRNPASSTPPSTSTPTKPTAPPRPLPPRSPPPHPTASRPPPTSPRRPLPAKRRRSAQQRRSLPPHQLPHHRHPRRLLKASSKAKRRTRRPSRTSSS